MLTFFNKANQNVLKIIECQTQYQWITANIKFRIGNFSSETEKTIISVISKGKINEIKQLEKQQWRKSKRKTLISKILIIRVRQKYLRKQPVKTANRNVWVKQTPTMRIMRKIINRLLLYLILKNNIMPLAMIYFFYSKTPSKPTRESNCYSQNNQSFVYSII